MTEYLGTINESGVVTNPDKTLAGDSCPRIPAVKRNVPGGFVVLDNVPLGFDVDAAIAALTPKAETDTMSVAPKATSKKVTDESA